MIAARADVVGSLLRPPDLLAAQGERTAGRLGQAAFKAVEDRAVDQAVAWQEAAGLNMVTDGEMRRLSFQSQLTEAVDGFGAWDTGAFLWGDWHGDQAVGDWQGDRPAELGVVDKLNRRRHLSVEEFVYLGDKIGLSVSLLNESGQPAQRLMANEHANRGQDLPRIGEVLHVRIPPEECILVAQGEVNGAS